FCRPGESFGLTQAQANALYTTAAPGWFDPPIARDCNSGLLHPNQGSDTLITEWTTWTRATNPNLPNGEGEPFLIRTIPVNDGKGAMFTTSNSYAWKMTVSDNDLVDYEMVSNVFQAPRGGTGNSTRSPRGAYQVSAWTYTTPVPPGAPGPLGTVTSRL